ncbi:hypothetical protein KUV73_04000 [Mameliella alba]|nr:hypothetical protein [Mameliella alba]MBY6168489.1 hypothetical protein [Mameliella alba]MBY6173508.1 hypothetical protein [Mameliella alba]
MSGAMRLTLPLAHLRLRLALEDGQGTFGLYPGEGSPAADKPLVSGFVGGKGNLTGDALREVALQVDVFEDAMRQVAE